MPFVDRVARKMPNTEDPTEGSTTKSESYEKINYYSHNAIASQAAAIFAGEPMVSSKQVIAPPPAPPVSYFRGNEFDLGAFATCVTGPTEGDH